MGQRKQQNYNIAGQFLGVERQDYGQYSFIDSEETMAETAGCKIGRHIALYYKLKEDGQRQQEIEKRHFHYLIKQHNDSGCQDQICKDLIHPKEFTFGQIIEEKYDLARIKANHQHYTKEIQKLISEIDEIIKK